MKKKKVKGRQEKHEGYEIEYNENKLKIEYYLVQLNLSRLLMDSQSTAGGPHTVHKENMFTPIFVSPQQKKIHTKRTKQQKPEKTSPLP